MKSVVITGTDTGVGKTWVTCRMLELMAREAFRVGAYKPVCSGSVNGGTKIPEDAGLFTGRDSLEGSSWQDIEDLSRALDGRFPKDRICPQAFQAALAPPVAARVEGRLVDDSLICSGADWWKPHCDLLLIEGAGGLLSPLSDRLLLPELTERMQASLVIVAGNRLGVVNHTLLTLRAAAAFGLPVTAVILNDCIPPSATDSSAATNAELLSCFIDDVPLYRQLWNSVTAVPVNEASHSEPSLVQRLQKENSP